MIPVSTLEEHEDDMYKDDKDDHPLHMYKYNQVIPGSTLGESEDNKNDYLPHKYKHTHEHITRKHLSKHDIHIYMHTMRNGKYETKLQLIFIHYDEKKKLQNAITTQKFDDEIQISELNKLNKQIKVNELNPPINYLDEEAQLVSNLSSSVCKMLKVNGVAPTWNCDDDCHKRLKSNTEDNLIDTFIMNTRKVEGLKPFTPWNVSFLRWFFHKKRPIELTFLFSLLLLPACTVVIQILKLIRKRKYLLWIF